MKLALASDLNQKELIHSDDHDEDEVIIMLKLKRPTCLARPSIRSHFR